MKRCTAFILWMVVVILTANVPAKASIEIANERIKYVIGDDGRNLRFIDKKTGEDYCVKQPASWFARIVKDGKGFRVSDITYSDNRMTLKFGDSGISAVIKVLKNKDYFIFEVESLSDADVDEMSFANIMVTCYDYVNGTFGFAFDDDFAVCLRGLNLRSAINVSGMPPELCCGCYRKYGIVGAKAALVGCPKAKVRDVFKELIHNEKLPYSELGGPWALDAEENRSSYIFANVTEANVDKWIALAKKAEIKYIHFLPCWQSLGHYVPRKSSFPQGFAGLKQAVDKIHAAGLKAGMHTLSGGISPHDSWVTPVPHKGLAKDATFTLAKSVDEKDATILTAEQPGKFDTVWGYGGRGNVIRVEDELIQYSDLSRNYPYGFTNCKRGAFGTRVSSHDKGAAVEHMFVRYGTFQPGENSRLLDEVAGAIGRVYNTCGFDMIYLDGAEGMPAGVYGLTKVKAVIFEKINRPVLVESSAMDHHSWPFRSRIGAWDYPRWGLKRFIDLHCGAVKQYRKRTLLPPQLGWWAIFGPGRNNDSELPDEIEYLCCKSLGYDAPMSFQRITIVDSPKNARQGEYLEMISKYEKLRLSNYFSELVKEKLKKRGDEFRLVQTSGSQWQFFPTDYAVHKVTGLNNGTARWTVGNRFGTQQVELRIKALYSVEPYDSAESFVLAEFAKGDEFTELAAAPNINHKLTLSDKEVKVGQRSGCYWAQNSGKLRKNAWSRVVKIFEPHLDMSEYDALGVWVYGDGKGELLNFQLANPREYYPARDEHYVKIDFNGWRYFELLVRERDAEQYGNYQWPYESRAMYSVYRASLVREHVNKLSLYFNSLPPGDEVRCHLSPVKALKTKKVKLNNPSINIDGKCIVFPIALESGCYIEFKSMADCRLYDERGRVIRRVHPQGQVPVLAAGKGEVKFDCQSPAGFSSRAAITVITKGEPLRNK